MTFDLNVTLQASVPFMICPVKEIFISNLKMTKSKPPKESCLRRLFCNLLGVGSAFSLIILILQLKFGILSPGPFNGTLVPITTVSPYTRVPTKVSTDHSDIMLKQEAVGRFFRRIFSVLYQYELTFHTDVYLNGQVCRSTPTAFQRVFISLGFKLRFRNGNLIRLKFLGLSIFIKDGRLCLGKVPHCIMHPLHTKAENTLHIGVRDDANGKTKTVYLTVNNKPYKVTLPLARWSRVRKIRLGSHRGNVYMTKLGVVFSDKGILFPVTRRLRCRPKLGVF